MTSRMMRHAGQEYGYLLEGELEVTVGFEVFTIGPGDALSFDSSVPAPAAQPHGP